MTTLKEIAELAVVFALSLMFTAGACVKQHSGKAVSCGSKTSQTQQAE